MQLLGTAVQGKMDFAKYDRGTFLVSSAASSVDAASQVFGLLLLGHDIFCLICALAGIIDGAYKRQLSYSLSWWATIFPVCKYKWTHSSRLRRSWKYLFLG